MEIKVSGDAVKTTIVARRPSWADMEKHYPAKNITADVLYDQMIGGRFKGANNVPAYKNTCAVRMSYALNRSGLPLGVAPSNDGSPTGGDGFRYWIRVSDLAPFLIKQFKGADEELTLPMIPAALYTDVEAMKEPYIKRRRMAQAWLDTKLAGKKGIVVFTVGGWSGATGHFTLWDGVKKTLAYANHYDNPETSSYYFWLTKYVPPEDGGPALVQASSVKFWELK